MEASLHSAAKKKSQSPEHAIKARIRKWIEAQANCHILHHKP